MTITIPHLGRGGLLAILAAGLTQTPVPALAQDDFYADKTVTIYVGFGPGGGYDRYGRLAADHLGQHIPGNPEIIVENMPGAGGRLAAQYLYNVADRTARPLPSLSSRWQWTARPAPSRVT